MHHLYRPEKKFTKKVNFYGSKMLSGDAARPGEILSTLKRGSGGFDKSSSDDRPGPGICGQQIRGGRKGRTECQGLGQSPNIITGSVSEWLKEAASKTVDRPKAVRRFESCRFRSCKGLAKVLANPFCIFTPLPHQCRSAPTIQTKEKNIFTSSAEAAAFRQ